jgi:imidazolonepropionase-like amidohydrolase
MSPLPTPLRRAALAALAALATLAALSLAAAPAPAQPSRGALARGTLARGTLAITDVAVVPMTADTVLRGVTVLVRDGRVVAVGPRVAVPAGARRVDGRGRWLVPGLADMHTHLYADDGFVPDSVAPDELAVMLANGVTAARLMIGTPQHLALRRDVGAGRVLGPQLWVAGPQLTGRRSENAHVVATPEEARAAVRAVADAGYDFVKLTLDITRPVYDAVVDEAARSAIRVVGHVDTLVGVPRALAAGQQIEHLDAYFEAALADSAPSPSSVTQGGVFRLPHWASLDHVDDRKLAALAGATARAPGWGKWFSPTQNVFNDAFAVGPSEEEIRARPEWGMLPPAWRDRYLTARGRYWTPAAAPMRTEARRRRYVEVRNRLVKGIVDSGGRLLAGSDTPEWFHLYGFALHRELQAYVAAGLTPYQALAAATRNPAEFLGASREWGTIAPGRRADLVLLAGNPLEDVRNTARIEGVAVGGRWLGRAELDAMLARARRRIGGG